MNIETMTPLQLKQALDESCRGSESCRLAAGLAKGAARRKYMRYAKQHSDNIKALSEALYGPIDDVDIDTLYADLMD